MITVYLLSIAALALFALLVVTPLLAALPDTPTDAETHDSEPQRDPWQAVSPVTPETFGRGSLPARIETVHNGRTVRLERPDYGMEEQLALISRIYEIDDAGHRTAAEEDERTILEEMYVRNVRRGMPDPHNDGIH